MNAIAKTEIVDIAFPAERQRLPYYPQFEALGIDNASWKVLADSIFPQAKNADSILMAARYCRARNLDILKKPVHIVPVWSSAANNGKGGMIDSIWPSIAELRTTAARTGSYAGKDETDFGPLVKQKLGNIEVEFPEWAQVTVYRIVQGVRCPFVGPKCYWLEYYATEKRDKKEPNERWLRARHGQLEKCAEAGALRAAFPEEIGNDYAAEEMEGQAIIDVEASTAPAKRVPPPAPTREAPPAPKPTASEPEKPVEDKKAPAAPEKPTEPAKAAPAAPQKPPKPVAYAQNSTAVLERFDARCAEAKDGDELNEAWTQMIDGITDDMAQPDYEQAAAIYRKHERRFEP